MIVNELKAWLATHGRISAVFVRHPAVDRFGIGAPIIAGREGDGTNRVRRGAKTASGPIAVERSTYFGLSSRYAVSDKEQFESLLAGLAHGFDVDNVRISRESMQDCVEEEQWRIEDTEYFDTKSGRWMRMPASASRKFDGKSDGASPFAAALLVPADPVADSIKISTGRPSGSSAKELVIAIGSMPTSMAVAKVLADAMGAPIPRKARPRRGSVPELVWPRCNPRLRGLSDAAQYAN